MHEITWLFKSPGNPSPLNEVGFRFTTSWGITYYCNFYKHNVPGQSPLYEIDLFPEDINDRPPYDPNTLNTAARGLFEFMNKYPHVLIMYGCDSGDGRHSIRRNAFLRCFNNLDNDQILNIPFDYTGLEDEIFFYDFYWHSEHPLADQMINVIAKYSKDIEELYTQKDVSS